MKKDTLISKRYAKALFDLAREQDLIEQLHEDMELIGNTLDSSKELQLTLSSPIIKSDKKQNILRAVFENKINDVTMKYLLIITKKGRESYLFPIAHQFIEVYKEYKNIITAQLVTATELNRKIREEVVRLLENQTKSHIDLIEKTDKEIIGGFIISYGDYKYDASISNQIRKLRKEFDVNLYVKGF